MQVVVDQHLVEYQLIGEGAQSILLLHGWTDAAQQSFNELARELAHSYKIVMPALPGFAKTPPPPDNWGVPEYARFLQQFVEKLNLAPDVVIAHSNGGTLAIYALSHGLLKPSKLVLLGSAGIRDTAKARKTALKIAAKPVKLLLKPLPRRAQERIKKRVYGQLGSDLYTLEHMKSIFKRVVEYDAQSDAQKLSVSTLLIYGVNDNSTPVSFGETFQTLIPHSRLQVVNNAGHYVQLDQPQKTTELIKDFLA